MLSSEVSNTGGRSNPRSWGPLSRGGPKGGTGLLYSLSVLTFVQMSTRMNLMTLDGKDRISIYVIFMLFLHK